MKKTTRILIWIAAVVTGLLLLLSLAGGPVAKRLINSRGDQLIGRRMEVSKVGLNLFTGHLGLRNMTVYEDDGTTPFASFDTLDLRVYLLQLPFHTVNLRHLTLSSLNAEILQQGERFNFSSIIEHFSSDDKDQDTTPSRWTLRLHNLRLAQASLRYRDASNGKELGLDDINIRVPSFAVGGKEQTKGGLNLNFSEGGTLGIEANHDAVLGRYNLDLALDNFDLENVEDIVGDLIETDHLQGTLSAHLKAEGEMSHLLQSQLGGRVKLLAFDLENNRTKVLGIDTLEVDINNINLDANRFDLQRIAVVGLYTRYEQWDGYNTWSNMLNPPPTETDTSEATPPQPVKNRKSMQLDVQQVTILRCAATYADHTLPDPMELAITNIGLDASNLSTEGVNNARLRATLPGGGHLALRWQGMLNDWKQYQDLFLTIKGMDIKQLNPLVTAYTGRGFDDGILGLSTRLILNNSQLDNQNKIDIYKAVVGKKRKGIDPRANIPLKTALYVLKDKDEKILIDLPVKGNIDNPEFNYMKVVWKTLGNLLVKVATSPVRAVGNMLGMGSDNLEFITIAPDQHSLTSEQYHTLSQLATVARNDNMLSIILERHFPGNDTTDRFDRQVRTYWHEQGLDDRQLNIVDSDSTDSQHRTGYAISSEMLIEE